MAWQGPNHVRDGHVLFPHYHFNHYVWIRHYYAHRYHPQKGVIVDAPAPHADPGSDRLQSATPSQTAAQGQPTAKADSPAIPDSGLPLRPALPDAPPYVATPAKPLPSQTAQPPNPGPPLLTPGQLQHHFSDVVLPHLVHAAPSALAKPTAPGLATAATTRTERLPAAAAARSERLPTAATARTERLATANHPDPGLPQHGFATSTLLILLALVILGTAATTFIVGQFFFRGMRRTGHLQPDRPSEPAAAGTAEARASNLKWVETV